MDDKKIIKKQKIAIIVLSILTVIYFAACLGGIVYYSTTNNTPKISYNGIEYEDYYAYVNLQFENNSNKQIIFNRENFSIKNTNIAKTSSCLFYEINVSYNQLTGTYILNSGEKIKIKLKFDKSDITNETVLYYNGEKVANL